MELTVIVFLVSALIVGLAVLGIILYTRRSGRALNVPKYQSRWLSIESSLNRDNELTYSLSVLEADKLLDSALRESGYKGETMGERMKSAKSVWKKPDQVWAAHKIRNRIAHETDVKLSYDLASRSLAAFKQGLKDLGAFDA